jgi:hypothetical protein
MQDESLEFTVRIDLQHLTNGGRAGISVFDKSASYIGVGQFHDDKSLVVSVHGVETAGPAFKGKTIQLRARVNDDTAMYSYSVDEGRSFRSLGTPVKLSFSWWKGARPAMFSFNMNRSCCDSSSNGGYIDVDWVHYRKLAPDLSEPELRPPQ